MKSFIVCFLLLISFTLLPHNAENDKMRHDDNFTKIHVETNDVKKDRVSQAKRNKKIRELQEIIKARPENLEKAEYYRQLAELYWEQAISSEDSPEKAHIYYNKAVEIYNIIINNYPAFQKLDAVYFFKADILNKTGQSLEALKYYKYVVSKYPDSKFISHSYYEIGQYYFNEDITAAVPNYKIIIEKYPDSKFYGLALYNYAFLIWHLEDYEQSVKFFQKAIEVAIKNNKPELKKEALRDIVMPYTEAGSADNAADYFKTFVKERNDLIFVLERLASTYVHQGQFEEAVIIYKKLLEEEPKRYDDWQKQISECRKQLETTGI